jgi:hypothetical protein
MIPPSYPDPFPYSWSPGMKKHEGLSLPIPLRQGKYMGKEKKVTNAQDKKRQWTEQSEMRGRAGCRYNYIISACRML